MNCLLHRYAPRNDDRTSFVAMTTRHRKGVSKTNDRGNLLTTVKDTIMPISLTDAKEQLTELVNQASHYKERVILTRRGKEIAAIISIEDLHLLQQTQNQADLHDALEALKEARTEGTTTLEQLKAQVG